MEHEHEQNKQYTEIQYNTLLEMVVRIVLTWTDV